MTEKPDEPMSVNWAAMHATSKFDIEHALGMYAISFCVLPAEGIYDSEALEQLGSVVDTCHIYLIGYTPKITYVDSDLQGQHLNLVFEILGKKHVLHSKIPTGLSLKKEADYSYLEDALGSDTGRVTLKFKMV